MQPEWAVGSYTLCARIGQKMCRRRCRRQHRILLTATFTCDRRSHLNYFTRFSKQNSNKAELRRDQYFLISGIWIGLTKYVYNITLKGGFGEEDLRCK